MGEARRKRVIREVAERIARESADAGLLIEVGFQSLIEIAYDGREGMPDMQYEQLREAFFGGAQHLFASILSIMDPDAEPTDADLAKMSLINNELERFIDDYKTRHGMAPQPHPTPQ